MAMKSKAEVCIRKFAGIAGSNPAGTWLSTSGERCVLWSRVLRDLPIIHREESFQIWCVWMWSRNLNNDEAKAQ